MASITPLTDGTLKLLIKDSDGNLVTTATSAVANVYSPKGLLVGSAVTLTYHSGDTRWYLPIDASWSDDGSGKAVQGEFVARVMMQALGVQLTDNIRYNVGFTDKS